MENSNRQKTAGVIIIGNEILSGRTQELNVAYIDRNLERLGNKLDNLFRTDVS